MDAAAEENDSSVGVTMGRVGNVGGHVLSAYANHDIITDERADNTDGIAGGITDSVEDITPNGITDILTDGIPDGTTDGITDSITDGFTDGSGNVSANIKAETGRKPLNGKRPGYLSASTRSCGATSRWRELSKAHEDFHRLGTEGECSVRGRGGGGGGGGL